MCEDVLGAGGQLAQLDELIDLVVPPLRVDRLGEHRGHGGQQGHLADRLKGVAAFAELALGGLRIARQQFGPPDALRQRARDQHTGSASSSRRPRAWAKPMCFVEVSEACLEEALRASRR